MNSFSSASHDHASFPHRKIQNPEKLQNKINSSQKNIFLVYKTYVDYQGNYYTMKAPSKKKKRKPCSFCNGWAHKRRDCWVKRRASKEYKQAQKLYGDKYLPYDVKLRAKQQLVDWDAIGYPLDDSCHKCGLHGHKHFNCPHDHFIMVYLTQCHLPPAQRSLDYLDYLAWETPGDTSWDSQSWRTSGITSGLKASNKLDAKPFWSKTIPPGPWRNLSVSTSNAVQLAPPTCAPALEGGDGDYLGTPSVSNIAQTNPFVIQKSTNPFDSESGRYLEFLSRKRGAPNYYWFGISFGQWLKEEEKRLGKMSQKKSIWNRVKDTFAETLRRKPPDD